MHGRRAAAWRRQLPITSGRGRGHLFLPPLQRALASLAACIAYILPWRAHVQPLWRVDLREKGFDVPAGSQVASFHYIPDTAALCTCWSAGEIWLLEHIDLASSAAQGDVASKLPPSRPCRWQAQDPADQVLGVEDMGVVEGGIAAAAWSPDGEQLVLAGGNGQLLLMNQVGAAAAAGCGDERC